MTEQARVVPNDGPADLLEGDCGVVLSVLRPCPDEPHGTLRCVCGAEILPRDGADEQ